MRNTRKGLAFEADRWKTRKQADVILKRMSKYIDKWEGANNASYGTQLETIQYMTVFCSAMNLFEFTKFI